MKKYYEILEVNQKSSKEVIEKAYRVLIKKYHPDLYSGEERIYAEQKTRDINEAYKILSDEFLREQYDIELEKENQFERSYTDYKKETKLNKNVRKQESEERNTNKVGTLAGIFDVTKTIFQNKPKLGDIRDLKREDYIAAGLTLIIILVLGVILWFIPATNDFVRSILPFV